MNDLRRPPPRVDDPYKHRLRGLTGNPAGLTATPPQKSGAAPTGPGPGPVADADHARRQQVKAAAGSWSPLKHRKAGDFRDVPVPDMMWVMVAALPDGPLCPGPSGTPYMPYSAG